MTATFFKENISRRAPTSKKPSARSPICLRPSATWENCAFIRASLIRPMVYLKKVVQSDPEEPTTHYLLAQAYRKMGKDAEFAAELELFQKFKKQEAEGSVKHPDATALGSIESTRERPPEEDSLDDLQ